MARPVKKGQRTSKRKGEVTETYLGGNMEVYLSNRIPTDQKRLRDMDTGELIDDLKKTYNTWYISSCEIIPEAQWWAKNRMLAIIHRLCKSEPLWKP